MEKIVISELVFEIHRSTRRKTLELIVDRDGKLIAKIPIVTNENDLRKWIESKLLWVHKKLQIKKPFLENKKTLSFSSGETITYLGCNYRLKIVQNQIEPLQFDGQWFRLRKADIDNAPAIFKQWYIKNGTPVLCKRVKHWARKTGTVPEMVKCSELGYRWGSCGKNNVIHFNWRLLQLEMRLIDYVIVHELVHLTERNHNKNYWRKLESILPDYLIRKSELDCKKVEMNWVIK